MQHLDVCDVTVNVCLQQCDKGGDLKFFLPEAGWAVRHKHQQGGCVALRGSEVPHGTYPVTKGERVTLTIQFNASRIVPSESLSKLKVQFSHFFELPAALQQIVLQLVGAGQCALFMQASVAARAVAGDDELWQLLYTSNQDLCSLVPVEQLLSARDASSPGESDTKIEPNSPGLLHFRRHHDHRKDPLTGLLYQLAYIREIRLLADWRTTYKVVRMNMKMVQGLPNPDSPMHRLRRVVLWVQPYIVHARPDKWGRQQPMYSPDSDGAYSSDESDY